MELLSSEEVEKEHAHVLTSECFEKENMKLSKVWPTFFCIFGMVAQGLSYLVVNGART